MEEKITVGKYVELFYSISMKDDDGNDNKVMMFDREHPDSFVYGTRPDIPEGFLKGIEGLAPGEKFAFTLEPEEAFGQPDPEMIIELDKQLFVIDGKFDSEHVRPGQVVPLMSEDGMRFNAVVLEVTADKVKVDFNHPLAGEQVSYEGEILLVRDATEKDMNAQPCGCGGGCEGCGSQGDCGGCNGGGCEGCN